MSADRSSSARRVLGAVIVALIVVSVAFRLLAGHHLEHTSLVFIGLPALAAFVLLTLEPKTAVGTINKVIAIALCLSGILFGEGLVCILFAAPIFFFVGTLVGLIVNRLRRRSGNGDDALGARWRAAIVATVVPFSLEGVVPRLELGRDEQVTATNIVPASVAEVRAALAAEPRFDGALPPFFRLGFPVPAGAYGSGLRLGDTRTVRFTHGQHHPGSLVMAVSANDSARVEFTAVRDDSYITHWLSWERAVVRLERIDDGRTRVRWTLHFRRRLDPAWYFAPLERYGASLAAAYLIETIATPHGERAATRSIPTPTHAAAATSEHPVRHHADAGR